MFPVPPLFGAVFEQGQIEARELYQVFNMGHRMEVYCEPAAAEAVIQLAATFNLDARIIGRTAASGGINRVTVETELGRFEY